MALLGVFRDSGGKEGLGLTENEQKTGLCSSAESLVIRKMRDNQKKIIFLLKKINKNALCYSDILNCFTETKTDIQLSFQFSTKYWTLFDLTVTNSNFFFTNQEAQL